MRKVAMSGQVQVASQLMQPTMLLYTCRQQGRSGSRGSTGGMESMGNLEQYSFILRTLFAL